MSGISGVKGQGSTRQVVVPMGPTASRPLVPKLGSLFFDTTTLKLYIFIGSGQPGADAQGWFNLKNAQYAA